MTPDERTALNEAVCKRLGWQDLGYGVWGNPHTGPTLAADDARFTSDWNAVYRWIVPAVKEMPKRQQWAFWDALTRLLVGHAASDVPWILYATPEDYCRAFLAVTEVDDGE